MLSPLANRLHPAQASGEENEVAYSFEPVCQQDPEGHLRALLVQAMSRNTLTLNALRSENIEIIN